MESTAMIVHYANTAMMLVLMVSMPPIIVATVAGLIVSIFQALTQIQEQTLPFAVKLIAIVISLTFVIPWAGSQLYEYAHQIFVQFPILTR